MTSLPSGEDLVAHVTEAYIAADGELGNDELYHAAADRAGISASKLNERSPIGRDRTPRSTVKRAIRWRQQELKALGLIERVPGAAYGAWPKRTTRSRRPRRGQSCLPSPLTWGWPSGVDAWR